MIENSKKVTDSQKKATKKWEMENREHSNYLKNRSACKTFIKNRATIEDIQQIEELLSIRKQELAIK